MKDGRADAGVVGDVGRARHPQSVADYVALTKPRLNLLVVATSAAGYYLGATGRAGCSRWRRRSPARRSSRAARRC